MILMTDSLRFIGLIGVGIGITSKEGAPSGNGAIFMFVAVGAGHALNKDRASIFKGVVTAGAIDRCGQIVGGPRG